MRDICGILGINRSSFYYQPREDSSEAVLRAEIEKLAGRYPRYGYRRITELLLRQGYTVGTRTRRSVDERNESLGRRQACGSNHKIASGGETLDQPARNP